MTPCPGCGAQESHCREALPECRRIAADRQHLPASAEPSATDDAALRSRVSELEAALRSLAESHRSHTGDRPWCTRCGADWTAEAHGHGCLVGRALRALAGVPRTPPAPLPPPAPPKMYPVVW